MSGLAVRWEVNCVSCARTYETQNKPRPEVRCAHCQGSLLVTALDERGEIISGAVAGDPTHPNLLPARMAAALAAAPQGTSPTGPLTLPENRESRNFLKSTRALLEGMNRERGVLVERTKTDQVRIRELDTAIAAFVSVLRQVNIEEPKLAAVTPRGAAHVRKAGQWGPGYDACKECGKSDTKHTAFGLCKPCYQRARKQREQAA